MSPVVSPVVSPVDPERPDKPDRPLDPTTKVTAVAYVYEKNDTSIPSAVVAALNRLNRERQIVATVVEDDVTDGDDEVPEQYRLPIAAARDAGLPALVVLSGSQVIRVVPAPNSAQQVWEAVP